MKWLILTFVLCLCSSSARALSLTELRADSRLLTNDASGTRQRFTDAQITGWLNEGQRMLDVRSLCVYKSFSFDLAAGTTYYSLPSDFLEIKRVLRDNIEIYEMTPAALDSRSSQWETSSGVPTYYFLNFSTRTKLGFAPFPALSTDLGTVKVDYIAYSTAMASDGDIPFGGTVEFYPYHYALSYYAAYKMSVIDERLTLAEIYLKQFEAMAVLIKERCIERPNYNPGMVGRKQ